MRILLLFVTWCDSKGHCHSLTHVHRRMKLLNSTRSSGESQSLESPYHDFDSCFLACLFILIPLPCFLSIPELHLFVDCRMNDVLRTRSVFDTVARFDKQYKPFLILIDIATICTKLLDASFDVHYRVFSDFLVTVCFWWESEICQNPQLEKWCTAYHSGPRAYTYLCTDFLSKINIWAALRGVFFAQALWFECAVIEIEILFAKIMHIN